MRPSILLIGLSLVCSASCSQPSGSEDGQRPPVAVEKFYNTATDTASSRCEEAFSGGATRCRLAWFRGIEPATMLVSLDYTPTSTLVGGSLVLGFEANTALTFYGERCGAVEGASGACPGLGHFELGLKDNQGGIHTVRGQQVMLSAFSSGPPTFTLGEGDQPVFNMLVAAGVSRAELRFVPERTGVPTMAKDVSSYFTPHGSPVALGYRLAKANGFAAGDYGL